MSGHPVGPPEWPRPGGYVRQHAVLVEAVKLIRAEWPWIERSPAKAKGKANGKQRA
jgi:hypothetical protein